MQLGVPLIIIIYFSFHLLEFDHRENTLDFDKSIRNIVAIVIEMCWLADNVNSQILLMTMGLVNIHLYSP